MDTLCFFKGRWLCGYAAAKLSGTFVSTDSSANDVCVWSVSVLIGYQDYLRPSVESILQNSLIAEVVAEEQRRAQARNRRRSAIGQGDADRPKTPAAQEHSAGAVAGVAPGSGAAEAAAVAAAGAELRLKEQVLRERETVIRQREERLESECPGHLLSSLCTCSRQNAPGALTCLIIHTWPTFSCVPTKSCELYYCQLCWLASIKWTALKSFPFFGLWLGCHFTFVLFVSSEREQELCVRERLCNEKMARYVSWLHLLGGSNLVISSHFS